LDVETISAPTTLDPEPETLDDWTVLPGLSVSRANAALIVEYRLPLKAEGVFVTDPGRFGVRVGLKTGDFVLKINDRKIDHPEDVRRAPTRPGRNVEMDVRRAGKRVRMRLWGQCWHQAPCPV